MLKIYNTITQSKQEFVPIVPKQVSIYLCGATVYDYCHIGHARTCIIFDSIVRYLVFNGYRVNYIRNITDVDDKILNKANQEQRLFKEVAEYYTKAMHQDFSALNLLPPTFEPKATDSILDMINLIKILLENDYAYIGTNGDVFYSVNKFEDYGKLSKRNLTDSQEGIRVVERVQQSKQEINDFVLWKLVEHQEVGWDSPWGYGRPGWHIECSAMSLKLLGKHFDIHGGGLDLIFPHHENEIAQSVAANRDKFVNYWIHVGFVQFNQEKMSKSLGNFILIKDVLNKVHPEVLKYWVLSSHYRTQVEFSYDRLINSKQALDRLYLALRDLPDIDHVENYNQGNQGYYEKYIETFKAKMDDDFNTPEAISTLFELAKKINIIKETSVEQAACLASLLKKLGQSIGLLFCEPEQFLHNLIDSTISEQEIHNLIAKRNQARLEKNWQEADLIRQQLANKGIYLEDKDGHTVWRKKI